LSSNNIVSIEDVNEIMKEVMEYTVWGLAEPDIRVKQFYLERIWISLGMSLNEIRDKLQVEHGIAPDYIEDILKPK
jgi:hypothetical protein